MPWGHIKFYRKQFRRDFKKGSFDWKLKGLGPFLVVESDYRATSPLTPTISPNTSNQNFEIAILFNVTESSGNYVFENNNPPTSLRARVVSYALGTYMALIESFVVETSKRAHLIGN